MTRRFPALLLALALLVSSALAATAPVAQVTDGSAAYIYKTVAQAQVGSIGGEWAILGLARSGYEVPEEYYQRYYATLERYVTDCGGVLHQKKYTEYSRVIVALSALGRDARKVAGYDLTLALGDYDKTIWQGTNGPIWALIALDSAGYPMPQNPQAKTQATRQMYLERILTCQLNDGGWSLTGEGGAGVSDPDTTGMALQALARYQTQAQVKTATDKALAYLSTIQEADGGYGSYGTANSESVVQVLVALTELGIPLDDPRFVKNGRTVLDNLLAYRQSDGSFHHTGTGGGSSMMASEQGLCALAAATRAAEGKSTLYRMDDALTLPDREGGTLRPGAGLSGKHTDVTARPITMPQAQFPDVAGHPSQTAIETMAQREIITGGTDGLFHPDQTMTRAAFSTLVIKALGLPTGTTDQFTDVAPTMWYAPFVGAAYGYGIVTGTGGTTFTPEGTISRQEAALMVARAAALCGLNTAMDEQATRNTLAPFPDYTVSDTWARAALAFCYQEGLLDQGDADIRPTAAITRGEVAQMLFLLLGNANLR